jgi:hypothetical protein
MVVLGGGRFLMSEVPLYWGTSRIRSRAPTRTTVRLLIDLL